MSLDPRQQFRFFDGSFPPQAGQGNEDELMDRETQLQLIEMGLTSPVTKESAGVDGRVIEDSLWELRIAIAT